MRRLLAIALLVTACGGSTQPTAPTSTPPAPTPAETASAAAAATPTEAPSALATPLHGPSADTSIVAEEGPGVTLKAGDSGAADLNGGRYRIAWLALGCTTLSVEWAPAGVAPIPLAIALPLGETFVDLPAGPGSLNRAGDCDYTIRFEAAS